MVVTSLKDLESKDITNVGMAAAIDGEKLPTDFMGIYHEKQVHSCCQSARVHTNVPACGRYIRGRSRYTDCWRSPGALAL
jgi:hypothetical protein